MPLTTDPQLLEICCDVVVRFKGHDSYGGQPGALKALRRRSPASSPEERLEVFEALCRVYDRAVDAIGRHKAERPAVGQRYSQPKDIDFDACMREL